MRKIIHQFLIIFSIAFVVLLLVDVTQACSCGYSTLDDSIKTAKNIVILELKSVTKYKKGEPGLRTEDGIKYSTLVVKKVFKGNLKVGQELKFGQGQCCVCIWAFEKKAIGEKYLFFLYSTSSQKGLWYGSICSRSNNVKSVSSDLLYLEKLQKVKGKTRLSGEVTKIVYSEKNEPSNSILGGIEIRIVGNGKDIIVKTNKDGIYEVYDLPVGEYRIIPQKIGGYRLYHGEKGYFEVKIRDGSLKEQDIEYLVD